MNVVKIDSAKWIALFLVSVVLQVETQIPSQNRNCKTLIDLIVVVDGSDSITAGDFQTLRHALIELIGEVQIGPDEARMGVIVYSRDIGAQVDVSGDVADLKYRTMNLPHPRDGTNTALGIQTMTNMFRTQGRPNVPTVGIVITDGISKNQTETARQAAIARSEGINMFAVGVTNLIDMKELLAIASSYEQVLSVTNFNELAKSLKSLMMLVCPTTTTATTTTTTTPVPTTTTVPYEPPTPDPNSLVPIRSGLCDKCLVINGVGYNTHPEDCDKFVQCYFDNGGENGAVQAIYRQCPFGTYWKQDILSCVNSHHLDCPKDPCQDLSLNNYPYDLQNRRAFWKCYNGKSAAMCCPLGQVYVAYVGCEDDLTSTEPCPPQTDIPMCDRRAIPQNPSFFEQQMPGFGWVRMPCAPGTNYNPEDCGCTLHGTYAFERVCKPELYIPFDTDCQDHSGKNVYVRNENVTVQNGVGFFDGNSRLLIPRFSNLNVQSELVIKLRYREVSKSMSGANTKKGGFEALITNGDCGSTATLVIAKSENNIHFGLKTTLGSVTSFGIEKSNTKWKEIVLIHDEMKLEGRVNNEFVVQKSVGQLQDSSCDLQVGHGDSFRNFIGYIDELSVYLCRPDDL